jgi:hypothetical protein
LNCSGKTTKEALRGRNGEDEGIQYNCVFRPNSLLPPYDISVLDDDTVSLAVIVPV